MSQGNALDPEALVAPAFRLICRMAAGVMAASLLGVWIVGAGMSRIPTSSLARWLRGADLVDAAISVTMVAALAPAVTVLVFHLSGSTARSPRRAALNATVLGLEGAVVGALAGLIGSAQGVTGLMMLFCLAGMVVGLAGWAASVSMLGESEEALLSRMWPAWVRATAVLLGLVIPLVALDVIASLSDPGDAGWIGANLRIVLPPVLAAVILGLVSGWFLGTQLVRQLVRPQAPDPPEQHPGPPARGS
jgi:hypothetical protein